MGLFVLKGAHRLRTPQHEEPVPLSENPKAGRLVLLNGLNLGNGKDLAAGWDDDTSLCAGPDKGRGKLIDLGADILQTDWPILLAGYIRNR